MAGRSKKELAISIQEVEQKLVKTQKKLEKAEERGRSLKEANLTLKQEQANLQKQLAETERSQDFMKLKELYDQIGAIESWSRQVVLPFGEFHFFISSGYIRVVLQNMKSPDRNEFALNDVASAQLERLCTVITEALEKQKELEELRKRTRPLASVITAAKEMIDEKEREEDY